MKLRVKGVVAACMLALLQFTATGQVLHFNTTEVELNNQPVKVRRLLQDRQGFVWLGTSEGLLRYTATGFQQVGLPGEAGKNSIVSAVYEDAENQLWVGFEDGLLARVNGSELKPVIRNGKQINSPIAAILQAKNKDLWVATYGQGLYVGKGNRFYHIGTKQGLPDDYTYSLAEDNQGRVWVGTDRGVAIIKLKNNRPAIEVLDSGKGLPDNIVTTISALPTGQMLIGMQSAGLTNYNPETGKFTTPEASKSWSYGSISLLQPHQNGTWVGTDAGLYWLQADGKRLEPAGLPKQKVTDLLTDREGYIWVAGNSPTLQRANTAIRSIPQLKGQTIHAVLAARDNSTWFATNQGFFRKPAGAPAQVFMNGRDKFQIVSLYEDKWGYIWLGTMGQGVLRLNPETGNYKQLTITDGLVNENVLSITGKGNELWLATLGGVSKCTINGAGHTDGLNYSFRNFTQQDGLGINYIYQAFIDSRNRVWFATDGKGLTMLQNGKFTNFSEKDGLLSRTVYSITEDRKGNIWLSTLNKGVYKYDGRTFRNYSLKDGLHDLNITGIAADGKGNILLLNRQGLDVLQPEQNTVRFYGRAAGIQEPDPNLNVISTGPDGRIWLGTQNGLLCYDPAFAAAQHEATTRLQDVQVFFKSVQGQRIFDHDSNHLTFNYTGLWYQNPEDITYSVKLNGYDRSWTESRNHSITYPNLPPGKYRFQVVSSATSQFPYANAVDYAFEIRPPFWRTYWFYGLTFLAAASGLYLFVKGREKRLREANRQEKDKVMFQFETLKSQVNPHFLFNSFNTLISTIEEDPEAAVVYVEKLSDFFRVMLTLREKDLIPLQEELDLLRDYVYLQQQRYRDNLEVTIAVPEASLQKQIAPLTLQLLLENAIKHNIISKSRPLQVQVFEQDDFIVMQNNFQPKQNPVLSTNIGLQNIRKRYHLLGAQKMVVTQTDTHFIVKIPLI
ncbi:histidine kinase [Pontibacter sp. Tf4]|uniref:ligand-binding sensor domain-containing protein n=1 Tax=Pontibacter sp. Tf4 TaxID=2761620 RepID=UPI00162AE51B|nr:sensor histidine kinase [Pontibacter sp. Tf4]MBB6610803.1 histidine kinase [Pontibacter sp. Tf4]